MLSIFSKTEHCNILIQSSSHHSTFCLCCILQHENLIDWAVKATTTGIQHLGIHTCICFYHKEKRGQKKEKKRREKNCPEDQNMLYNGFQMALSEIYLSRPVGWSVMPWANQGTGGNRDICSCLVKAESNVVLFTVCTSVSAGNLTVCHINTKLHTFVRQELKKFEHIRNI